MFTYSTQPRGSVVHALCLSEALARAGEDVTLFALSKNQAPMFRQAACRVELIDFGAAAGTRDAA